MQAIPAWFTLFAASAVFSVMLSLGLLIGREQLATIAERSGLLAAILFAVVVPLPLIAVLLVKLLGVKGAVAAGILLMAISPGAPVALRRALEAGAQARFAPALHLAVVVFAVVTVPASLEILDWIFARDFKVSVFDVARQVFFAQILPIGVGAALRALHPGLANRIEPRLAKVANALLLAFAVTCVIVLWPMLAAIGWAPFLAGAGLTACALPMGMAAAHRHADIRPAAGIAVAMRNPGLALLIAGLNKLPVPVTAAIFGYALGGAAVIAAFVLWQGRRPPS